MLESEHVMKCLESMQSAVDIPVSIKCRLGVDKEDSYEFLYNFVIFIIFNMLCIYCLLFIYLYIYNTIL